MLADAAVIGQGVLGRRGRRRWATASRSRSTRHAAGALAEGAGAAPRGGRRSRARPSTRSGTSSRRDVAYGQLPRASRAVPARRRRATGSSPRRPTGSRTSPTCSPTTTRPPSSSPGRRGRPSRRRSSKRRHCGSSASPGNARSVSTPPRRSRASSGRSRSTPAGHPERPAALARFGEAALQAGRTAEAAEALEEAIASFRERGDLPAAARAMGTLGSVLFPARGSALGGRCRRRRSRCSSRCRPGPSSSVRSPNSPRPRSLQGRDEAGVALRRTGARLSPSELGLPRPARTLGFRAIARGLLGDPGGLDDFREAIGLATEAGQGTRGGPACTTTSGSSLWTFEGPAAALEVMRAGIAFAQARGPHRSGRRH